MKNFLDRLRNSPENINFEDTIMVIDEYYSFEPTAFHNGEIHNKSNETNGSCKLFAFAKIQKLSEQETLNCFGQYYRNDVLENPQGSNHLNIRNFMKTGWSSIVFEKQPLTIIKQ